MGEGQFNWPMDVVVDNCGYIYVSDYHNCRIQKFDSDGEFLDSWGSCGKGEGELDGPLGLALDPLGHVIVSDTVNHRIQVFEYDGRFVSGWGSHGPNPGELNGPWGLAFNACRRLYVVDQLSHRVQKFLLPDLLDPQMISGHMVDEIDRLFEAGYLNQWQRTALQWLLNEAMKRLEKGQIWQASIYLRFFVLYVQFLVAQDVLTDEEGCHFITLANAIIGPSGECALEGPS